MTDTSASTTDIRVADIAYWRDRMTWTDAQFLAEYCDQQRQQASNQVADIEAEMKADAEAVPTAPQTKNAPPAGEADGAG